MRTPTIPRSVRGSIADARATSAEFTESPATIVQSRSRLDSVAAVDLGRVIVLNGPSSAGKTTLANAVRMRIGPTIAIASIDQFFSFVHPETRNNWQLFSTLTNALFATTVSLSDGGFHVIVDTVFERTECLATMQRTLAGRPHQLVAVVCPLDVLEARERARGNRRLGQTREQYERVLCDAPYDTVIDTLALPLDACVDRIAAMLAL